MTDHNDDLTKTIEQLTSDVRTLSRRVEVLERTVKGVSGAKVPAVVPDPALTPAAEERESALSVGGVAALMSRGAMVSLILLMALVLRTLTDGGVLRMGVGTALGIGYATLLEGLGWFLYRKKSSFAPIFSISGILLLTAVVLEAHAGFGSISTVPAYAVLVVAAGGMAVISRQYRVSIPVTVGTLAVMAASVPLSFPDPHFPALAVFLFAVNLMAFNAAVFPRAGWLRIAAFVFTAGIVFLWGIKLRAGLSSGVGGNAQGSPALQPGEIVRFVLAVAVYVTFYVGICVAFIWKRAAEERRPFDHLLPTAAVAWGYLSCLMVISAVGSGQRVLGASGILAATLLLGLAAVKGSRKGTRSRGTTTFAFPAAVLLALSFRDVSGQSVVALAILSWAALSLAWFSNRWSSAGVRVTGYFLQATVLGASFLLLVWSPAGKAALPTAASMTAVCVIAFFHYRLTRNTEPPGPNEWFTRLDRKDICGVLPLLVSVGAASFAGRALLFTLSESSVWIFQAGETVIINAGALALFAAARSNRNAEFKWVAVLVTAVGGGKVFLYDLLRIKGIPVVVSVLSFALPAAFGSWVLSRWHRTDDEK